MVHQFVFRILQWIQINKISKNKKYIEHDENLQFNPIIFRVFNAFFCTPRKKVHKVDLKSFNEFKCTQFQNSFFFASWKSIVEWRMEKWIISSLKTNVILLLYEVIWCGLISVSHREFVGLVLTEPAEDPPPRYRHTQKINEPWKATKNNNNVIH